MPWYLKIMALLITIAGFAIALDLNNSTNNLKPTKPSPTSLFSTSLGCFPTIMHRLLPLKTLNTSIKTALTMLDHIWLEKAIPKATSTIHTLTSSILSSQKGMVKLYFLSFLITLITIPVVLLI